MSTVDWRYWLCEAETMNQIAELEAHSKTLAPQLNSFGKASCWTHLFDPDSGLVTVHQTALRCDRNNQTVWSGPIFQTAETTSASTGEQSGTDQLQITALGWLQNLNQRLVHTGAEFQTMLNAPNGIAWQATNGYYVSLGTDSALTLVYSASGNPLTTDAAIIFDLLDRANIDSPTGITKGNIYGSPVQRNQTLNRFQSVGQQINQLVNVESGCDIYVDPVTRKMNLYGPGASSSPTISNGRGVDRGQGTLFSYPGNCIKAQRNRDGTQTTNREEVIGQYGVGRADSPSSQAANGLFEVSESLSEVVDINILIAYANVQVVVKQNPWTTINFTPRSVAPEDLDIAAVPQPYVDYDLGDIVYGRVDRGSLQIGTRGAPQAVRVFGFNINAGDDGVEKVSSIATTYQGLGAT